MGWFERQVGSRDAAEVNREHARYVRASKVVECLDDLAGPFGCRRFLVRFERLGGRVRIVAIDAATLSWGGGPPPSDPNHRKRDALERALNRLHANMSLGPGWNRGVFAYVRDAHGVTEVNPAFDEDSDIAQLETLPVPGPPGHPLEEKSTLDLLAIHTARMHRIVVASRGKASDWDWWEVDDDTRLTLHYEGHPSRTLKCMVLATHETHASRFTWHSPRPVGSETVFQTPTFASTFDASMEVGFLSCAALDAEWLFVQPYDDRGGQLLVAVFR
ncbi:MAG: hypothetical protein CL927_13065 [Deltaproteobacteria bacterium]|nr:hypothetical protein [Deltaproteobacteria bacterium]